MVESMKINSEMSYQEKVVELSKQGLIKRTHGRLLDPVKPPRRPLTIQESKILTEYYGSDYKWDSIDANGYIILGHPENEKITGKYFVTEEDLKNEIRRIKNAKV